MLPFFEFVLAAELPQLLCFRADWVFLAPLSDPLTPYHFRERRSRRALCCRVPFPVLEVVP